MARIDTTQAAVLLAVKARVVAACPALSAARVFVCDADEVPEGSRDSVVVTLWPTDGLFDKALWDGGGAAQTVEQTGVEITVFVRNWSDRMKHGEQALTAGHDGVEAKAAGLLSIKHQLLRALSAHDLADDAGDFLLREPMRPIASGRPRRSVYGEQGKPVGDLALLFATDLDWRLVDPEGP